MTSRTQWITHSCFRAVSSATAKSNLLCICINSMMWLCRLLCVLALNVEAAMASPTRWSMLLKSVKMMRKLIKMVINKAVQNNEYSLSWCFSKLSTFTLFDSDSLNYFHNWLCLQNLHKQKYIKDSYSYYWLTFNKFNTRWQVFVDFPEWTDFQLWIFYEVHYYLI